MPVKRVEGVKRHHIILPDPYWNALVSYAASSGQRMSISGLIENMLRYFVEEYIPERLEAELRPEIQSDWVATKESVRRFKLGARND